MYEAYLDQNGGTDGYLTMTEPQENGNKSFPTANKNLPTVNKNLQTVNKNLQTVNKNLATVYANLPSVNKNQENINKYPPSVNKNLPNANKELQNVNKTLPNVNRDQQISNDDLYEDVGNSPDEVQVQSGVGETNKSKLTFFYFLIEFIRILFGLFLKGG